MRSTTFVAISSLACGIAATAFAQQSAPPPAAPAMARVAVMGPNRSDLGTVMISEAPKGVIVRLQLKGLTPGWHAIHFHEKGDCSNADFTSAGGHVHEAGATPTVHGLLNPDANDQGDLPNVYAGADGMVNAEVFSMAVALKGPAGRSVLMDADGSALVVHANPDDYKSQPIGGAGARVGCGVIK